jgi:sugar phosphate isomerase/epimerase
MSSAATRREFLRNCALASGGMAGVLAGGSRSGIAHAIEPIARNGASFFKFSLAAYSYRDLLNAKSPRTKLTLDDFIADCAKMNLQGTELTSYYFPKEPTNDYLRHLKQLCFRLGLDISGTAVGNDFCYPPGTDRDREIGHVKQWVDYAEMLGAPVIRIFSGHPRDTSQQEAHKLCVEGIEECCQYAGDHGVFLALENHGGLTTTADGLMSLVHDVKSPWFGVNLDTGNFRSDDVSRDIARFAPYAINVQVKVSIAGPNGKRQKADFARLARILAESGYRGYIVLEFEESENPTEACPRYIDELRLAFTV